MSLASCASGLWPSATLALLCLDLSATSRLCVGLSPRPVFQISAGLPGLLFPAVPSPAPGAVSTIPGLRGALQGSFCPSPLRVGSRGTTLQPRTCRCGRRSAAVGGLGVLLPCSHSNVTLANVVCLHPHAARACGGERCGAGLVNLVLQHLRDARHVVCPSCGGPWLRGPGGQTWGGGSIDVARVFCSRL